MIETLMKKNNNWVKDTMWMKSMLYLQARRLQHRILILWIEQMFWVLFLMLKIKNRVDIVSCAILSKYYI